LFTFGVTSSKRQKRQALVGFNEPVHAFSLLSRDSSNPHG
jgi:hypothetical protein